MAELNFAETIGSIETHLKIATEQLEAIRSMIENGTMPVDIEDAKQCSCCKEYLPLTKFHIVQRYPSGKVTRKAFCKECDRMYRLVNEYYKGTKSNNDIQLTAALAYFKVCKNRGGKTDYKWWHVDDMLEKYDMM